MFRDELVKRLVKLNKKDRLVTGIDGVLFRGDELGRFKHGLKKFGYYLGPKDRTIASIHLIDAMWYAKYRAGQRGYDENRGLVNSMRGFPVVVGINVNGYDVDNGLEGSERIIYGRIRKEDIAVLFDNEVDFLRDLDKENLLYDELNKFKDGRLGQSKKF